MNKNERRAKLSLIITFLALLVAIAQFLFGDEKFWAIKEFLFPTAVPISDTEISDENQAAEEIEMPNSVEGEAEDIQNNPVIVTQDDSIRKNPYFMSDSNNCDTEAHGYVENMEELNGFIASCRIPPSTIPDVITYLNIETGAVDRVLESVPLHHVVFDFSNYDFNGMGVSLDVNVGRNTRGLAIEPCIENDTVEAYISEGTFTLRISRWKEEYIPEHLMSIDVTIDHCGIYTLQ